MTEVEWLAGQAQAVVAHARATATMRQRRPLACGCWVVDLVLEKV